MLSRFKTSLSYIRHCLEKRLLQGHTTTGQWKSHIIYSVFPCFVSSGDMTCLPPQSGCSHTAISLRPFHEHLNPHVRVFREILWGRAMYTTQKWMRMNCGPREVIKPEGWARCSGSGENRDEQVPESLLDTRRGIKTELLPKSKGKQEAAQRLAGQREEVKREPGPLNWFPRRFS